MLTGPFVLPCGAALSNRLVKAAMSEQLAGRNGEPSAELLRLYKRWSACGAALLITGNVMVAPDSTSEPGQVVLCDDTHLDRFKAWARVARSEGVPVWMQINHAGAQVPRTMRRYAVSPSGIGMGRLFAKPMGLFREEILEIVERFANTAALAVGSGFDGVQIHAAHGYLASQFLSPGTNTRTDPYGGSPSRRRRFLLEVIEAVRGAVGPAVPIAVKINSADFTRHPDLAQEALEHVKALGESPIDLIEISGGDFNAATMLGVGDTANARIAMRPREAYFLEFAVRARGLTRKPIMLTGGFRRASTMADAIATGAMDFIGLARPMVVEADFARRVLESLGSDDVASLLDASPRSVGARGLLGGLSEVSWHTVQLGRLARGVPIKPHLGVMEASARLALRQLWQLARLRAR